MTGAWIETKAPTLARVGHRRQRWVPWVLVLAVTYLAVGLAATASRWRVGQLWGNPVWEFERTVWPHAAAMTLVVWLALAVSVPLLRARLFAVAVAVCAGAAFGPLRLVAAPIHGDLEFIDQSPSATQAAWPVAVAAALTVLLIVVARRLARRVPCSRGAAGCAGRGGRAGVPGDPVAGPAGDPRGHRRPGPRTGVVVPHGHRVGAAGRWAARRRAPRRRGHVERGMADAAGRGRPGDLVVGLPPRRWLARESPVGTTACRARCS